MSAPPAGGSFPEDTAATWLHAACSSVLIRAAHATGMQQQLAGSWAPEWGRALLLLRPVLRRAAQPCVGPPSPWPEGVLTHQSGATQCCHCRALGTSREVEEDTMLGSIKVEKGTEVGGRLAGRLCGEQRQPGLACSLLDCWAPEGMVV